MTSEKSPIMLALCLMILLSYYAQNYAGIIGSSLHLTKGIYVEEQGRIKGIAILYQSG